MRVCVYVGTPFITLVLMDKRGELTLSVNLYIYINSLYPFYNFIRKIFAAEETEHRKVNS